MTNLIKRLSELNVEMDLNGLQVRYANSPMFYTVEGNMLRTPQGVIDLVPSQIIEAKIAECAHVEPVKPVAVKTLKDFTLAQIKAHLKGIGLTTFKSVQTDRKG